MPVRFWMMLMKGLKYQWGKVLGKGLILERWCHTVKTSTTRSTWDLVLLLCQLKLKTSSTRCFRLFEMKTYRVLRARKFKIHHIDIIRRCLSRRLCISWLTLSYKVSQKSTKSREFWRKEEGRQNQSTRDSTNRTSSRKKLLKKLKTGKMKREEWRRTWLPVVPEEQFLGKLSQDKGRKNQIYRELRAHRGLGIFKSLRIVWIRAKDCTKKE